MDITINVRPNKIISGFPGIGKSKFFEDNAGLVADSDSSKFDKAYFPENYMEHIADVVNKFKYVLVSSHDVVRAALVDRDFEYTLVYPAIECKEEYLKRYTERGSPAAFVSMMDANWDKFVYGCMSQEDCTHVVLQPGEYLSDKVNDIL